MGTVGEALRRARESLREDSEYPARDAVLLLAHVLDRPPSYPYLHPDEMISAKDEDGYFGLIERRIRGEPVAYLRGYQEFMGLRLKVDRRVLIPRPETEILVEAAATALCGRDGPVIADVCCGSGAIGISLARTLPGSHAVLTDASADALEVARDNAASLGVSAQVEFLQGDLVAPLLGAGMAGVFDLVASNPPYIAEEELASLPRDVGVFEPRMALDGGPGGLRFIERLAVKAPALLKPNGLFFMEMGDGQGEASERIFAGTGKWREMQVIPDYAGRQRVFRAIKV